MCEINVDTNALVRKYETLVHSVLSKKLPTYIGDEDLVQVGRIALWKSAKRYDPDKGKFSTYAYKAIYHAMLKELSKRKSETSLNAPVAGDDELEFQDTIADLRQSLDGAELRFELEDFYKTLKPKKQEILRRKANGETYGEIAKAMNISYFDVGNELKSIRKLWNRFQHIENQEEEQE